MEFIFFVFIFFYPLFMAVYWMTGALIFFNRRERNNAKPPELDVYPHVSILVPCHNEERVIARKLANDFFTAFNARVSASAV